MTKINEKRLAALRRRFPGRELLPQDELYSRYFSIDNVSKADVDEVLSLLAEELALPSGFLRPDDRMEDILEPVHSGGLMQWIEEWTRAADGKAELNDVLRRRLEGHGTAHAWDQLPTIRDVVLAWCGRTPSGP